MSFEDEFDSGNDFGGIQESPIPDMLQTEDVPKRKVAQPQKRQGGIPDPNHIVAKPENRPKRNYDAKSASGARQGRTEEMNQGFSQPGQSIKKPQNQQSHPTQQSQAPQQGQVQQQRPQQRQRVQQRPKQRPQQRQQGQQVPNQQMQMNQQMQQPNGNMQQNAPKPKKKGKLIPIVIGVVVIAVVAVVGVKVAGGKKLVAQEVSYESSGRYALDALANAVSNYDATTIDAAVGVEDGDSYIAQEWSYVNDVKLRQEFIKKACAVVTFEYPQVQQMSTTGVGMTDANGSPIMIESYMNNGEAVSVTIPDYEKLSASMDEDKEYILKLFKSSKYSEADYTWNDEMTNLMLQYICDKDSIPTKKIDITLPVRVSVDGKPYVEDDALLDDALFGSDEFHDMCAKFSQICLGWTGFKDEHYTEQELQHNPEYDEWLDLFLTYFEADGGVYDKATGTFSNVQKAYNKSRSKWEPWYLRNDDNEIQKNEDGTYIVNYFSVKDKNGKDWIQPDEKILVDVDKVRQIEDPWVDETVIMYNWIGQNFIQNRYTGSGSTVVRVGDGSFERPAGIGTTIITKVLGTDGLYHDVKVAMMGYWTEQDAIDYAEKFSTKNRGFTTSSVVQLICYEIYVENLENKPITFLSSEMTLTDKNTNVSSRTGTMYGFSGEVTLAAHGDKDELDRTVINDWATSTELAQKYVCWGKDFGRLFSMVYFDCLAGTGEIPTYSAYKQFTGESIIEDTAPVDETITGDQSSDFDDSKK